MSLAGTREWDVPSCTNSDAKKKKRKARSRYYVCPYAARLHHYSSGVITQRRTQSSKRKNEHECDGEGEKCRAARNKQTEQVFFRMAEKTISKTSTPVNERRRKQDVRSHARTPRTSRARKGSAQLRGTREAGFHQHRAEMMERKCTHTYTHGRKHGRTSNGAERRQCC